MQQQHNQLPHMAGSGAQLHKTIDTVLQGLLVHGKQMHFYRHFGNVSKGANIALYAWLSSLELEYKDKGKLPDTLYHQIDGTLSPFRTNNPSMYK